MCQYEEELRTYVNRYGFSQDGNWYFRASWMRRRLRKYLENVGAIKRIGTLTTLRNIGVEFPPNHHPYVSRTVFYTVSERIKI